MTPSLKRAVEDVYLAFNNIPRPISIDGCPCCIDDKGISVLLSKPLRDLSPDELSNYAQSVFLTVGSLEDFLYFLPRILEILASDAHWWPLPEVVARALHTAGFHSWPDDRQQAITHFFREIIHDLLSKEGNGLKIDSWICALARMGVDLSPYLNQISANPARLIEFYEVNSDELIEGQLANSFWDDAPKEMRKVVEWFGSSETKCLLKAL